MHVKNQAYRSDIDGLRSIAVLLVVLYHAKFPILGGFVGVDVFFVISGYLITSIIKKEINEGVFSFGSFYIRRIKRLLPAYIFMLLCLFIYCYNFLMPDDLVSFAKSSVYSLFALSNYYFYAGTGYFGTSASEPLLHTWSIAVEEQFYIFWPVLLILVSKIKTKSITKFIFLVLFFGSIILSQYYSLNHKNAAYLLLPFRFFELMIGCLLAIYQNLIAKYSTSPTTMSLFGIGAIVGSALFLNESYSFPGLNALPVCIGAAMVISSSFRTRNGLGTKFLSTTPLRYIGKISYSLYLWHWPILILASYRGIELNYINSSFLVLASILVASISYHIVETPFRKLSRKKFLPIFSYMYVIPTIVFCLVSFVFINNDGYKESSGELVSELDESNTSHVQRAECISKMHIGNISDCHLGIEKKNIDGMLIGDSFANAYAPFVNELAKDANLMIHDTTAGSTPAIPGIFMMDMQNKISENEALKIAKYNTDRYEMAKKQKFVILSNFWNNYASWQSRFRIHDEHMRDVTDIADELQFNTVKGYLDAGVKVVILVQPYTEIGRDNINKLRSMKLRHANAASMQFKPVENNNDRIEYKIKKKFPQVILIDPNDVLCKNNYSECTAVVEGKIIFRLDGSHLNAPGASAIGKEYIKKSGNPLNGII